MNRASYSAVALWVLALVAPCDAAPKADTIYWGGPIVTVNDRQPSVEAVAVGEGKILAAGTRDEVQPWRGDQTRIIDLAGKTLIPGLIDPHSHLMSSLQMANWANLTAPPTGTVTSIADIVAQLQKLQARLQPAKGEWIIGFGYDPDTLSDHRNLTRHDLDPAFPDHPVMVIHISSHGCVLNSAGLRRMGIDANTPTPDGGVILRDPGTNDPAGTLMETAFLPIFSKMPQPNEEDLLGDIQGALRLYASNGYTTVQEGATTEHDVLFLQKAASRKLLTLDVIALPIFTDAARIVGNPSYEFGVYKDGLKLGGVKSIVDGSPQGKTAFWTQPLVTNGPAGQASWRGAPNVQQKDLNAVFELCYRHGVQTFTHANGDAAIDMAIAAHRAAAGDGHSDRRPIVVHSQFIRPDQLDAYVQLGLIPSFFTNHAFFWGDVHVRNLGVERAFSLSPAASALKRGLRITNHTDAPVTPLNAMFTLWTAVNRRSRSGAIIGPDERIEPIEALKALTIHAAYQHFEEATKGSLEPGKVADLVILSDNPLTVPKEALREIRVLETIKRGQSVYRAEQ